MTLAILIPAYNDVAPLARTLRALGDRADEAGGVTVFLVDDGSEPPIDPLDPLARRELPRRARAPRVNLGQGAALETARQLALRRRRRSTPTSRWTPTASTASRTSLALAPPIADGADVAFGNRFLGDSNVPRARARAPPRARASSSGRSPGSASPTRTTASAPSAGARSSRSPIRQNRMAHATEIKQRVSRAGRARVVEVPVSVRYTRESLAKGQTSLGAVVILRDLLLQYLFGEHEVNLAAVALLALVFGLVVFDWATLRGKNRRALLLEVGGVRRGRVLHRLPRRATALAHLVGIGRGVDFLLYPIVIWLVRESLLTRRRRREDGERLTQLARALAIAEARRRWAARTTSEQPTRRRSRPRPPPRRRRSACGGWNADAHRKFHGSRRTQTRSPSRTPSSERSRRPSREQRVEASTRAAATYAPRVDADHDRERRERDDPDARVPGTVAAPGRTRATRFSATSTIIQAHVVAKLVRLRHAPRR